MYIKSLSLKRRILSGHPSILLKIKTKKLLEKKLIFQIVKNVNKQAKESCEESFMGDVKEDKQPSVSGKPR